ncbi:glycosyltransferase family 4 protein [Cyanobacterium sp. Dongsha4]|uniref:glycosyltransferase family 4 protein n=1 Tax=Cyanobacterium sp. DS4 TaxID=2878255 RepID=UPI002E8126EC|nr:glycosyltransferase family 4 protein [Cyanobacterium sp. Dongsha4]WVK99568.1 glycosyltransferase family 4 protein [Cyanobacterium sp. Dongsha4]
MKIAYISWSGIPSRSANSIQVMKMCEAFTKNGHEVLLFVKKQSSLNSEPEDIYSLYGIEQKFDISYLPPLSFAGAGYLYSILALPALWKFKPDVIYCRLISGCLLGLFFNIPSIFESHSDIGKSGKVAAKLLSWLVNQKKPTRIVTISNALKESFVNNYQIPDKLVCVAHDGADDLEKNQKSLSSFCFDSDVFRVGYIGQLYKGKGMEIISQLAPLCPWAQFHIIGGTEEDLKIWKEKTNELSNLIFYGFLPYSQTHQYRSSFDVLIAPYLKKVGIAGHQNGDVGKWMSPLKIFEYMSVSKPIITSDLPVLKEVLEDNKTALLCNPDDINDWAKALLRLRDDSSLREHLGSNARKEFLSKYTWKARANFVLSCLEVT